MFKKITVFFPSFSPPNSSEFWHRHFEIRWAVLPEIIQTRSLLAKNRIFFGTIKRYYCLVIFFFNDIPPISNLEKRLPDTPSSVPDPGLIVQCPIIFKSLQISLTLVWILTFSYLTRHQPAPEFLVNSVWLPQLFSI